MADGKKVLELVVPVKREVNSELVDCLKRVLAMAEAGEIRGLAASLDLGNGKPALMFAAEEGASRGALLLGIVLLQRKIEDACVREAEEG